MAASTCVLLRCLPRRLALISVDFTVFDLVFSQSSPVYTGLGCWLIFFFGAIFALSFFLPTFRNRR
jgi:hypothetical protein